MATRATKAEESPRRPAIHREPQLPSASRYEKVEQVRGLIAACEGGEFAGVSRLIRQMWQNLRLRVAMSTRIAGLTSAEVRWRAAADTPDARRALEAIRVDWPLIISTATRKQRQRWALLLGLGLAQRNWYRAPTTGREIPRVQVYYPGWARWDWTRRQYAIRVDGAELQYTDSPALVTADSDDPWLKHEPFGQHSWAEGYVVSAWYTWLGNNLTGRDRLRSSEKVGEGNLLAQIPHGADPKAAADFTRGLKDMKGGAVIPCEVGIPSRLVGAASDLRFDVKPLEWNAGNGYQVIADSTAATAVDLVILFVGGNMQTEIKGGGSYAAVDVQSEVRADYIEDDAAAELDTDHRQLIRPWTVANFGDPDLAPIREVVSDPPERDKAQAQILSLVAAAIPNLRQHMPEADLRAIFELFRLPLHALGEAQLAVPGEDKDDEDPPVAGEEQPAPGPDAQTKSAEGQTTIPLTPSDTAAIATVDEGRESLGLPPIGGEIGKRWIVEHAAKVKSEAAPEIAEAAQAEQGRATTEPEPPEPDDDEEQP